MKAVRWYDSKDIRVEDAEAPRIHDPGDVIVKVTAVSPDGSDLHAWNGLLQSLRKGDILGSEFLGEVVEKGAAVRHLKVGDRVAVSPAVACGRCWFCRHGQHALCDNTHPNGAMQARLYGAATAGHFGGSHAFGGHPGALAEFARIPHADVIAFKVPPGLAEEKVLFTAGAFAAGWSAAEGCGLRKGDSVAVWGCGAVGQLALKSARLLGAERVIAIDRVVRRLAMARRECGAEVVDFSVENVHETLMQMTGGRGPDACIDAVGMDAQEAGSPGPYGKARQLLRLDTDRPVVLRQMILACRKGGNLFAAGDYVGLADKLPFGALMHKGLTLRSGRPHAPKLIPLLFERIQKGEVDPSSLATHRMPLEKAPEAFRMFNDRSDGCQRVILRP